MLRKIDIIPLQVLIEATIAEVDLNDTLQYGTQFFFNVEHVANTLGPSGAFNPAFPALGHLPIPSTLPTSFLSQVAKLRARGAFQCIQGQSIVGATGHGSRQRAGTAAGRPASAGSDRDTRRARLPPVLRSSTASTITRRASSCR